MTGMLIGMRDLTNSDECQVADTLLKSARHTCLVLTGC